MGSSIGKGLIERNLREAGKEQAETQKDDESFSMAGWGAHPGRPPCDMGRNGQ